jgi:pantetheine-phosphate adenylyltransferase
MKIGIYSGMFDPPHAGHLWVIDEMQHMFDKVHVAIGPNPYKIPLLPIEKRQELLQELVGSSRVEVSILKKSVGDLAISFGPENHVTIMRGVRNMADVNYEDGILNSLRARYPNIHAAFLVAPKLYKDATSSYVKSMAKVGLWAEVIRFCPKEVMEVLKDRYYEIECQEKMDDSFERQHKLAEAGGWIVEDKEVASIFETGTAGFAPEKPKCRTNKSCSSRQVKWKSTSDHQLVMRDLFNDYEPNPWLDSQNVYFSKAVAAGLINLADTIDADQVKAMLDPTPVDVVASDKFHLKKINIGSVQPTGNRYIPCSRSLGPIIVDLNILPNPLDSKSIGPAIVIEGKHRWLDARERGETTIAAWVGEKALHFVTEAKE